MQIPASLHGLLSGFTLDVSPSMWWAIVDEYVDSEPNANCAALAAELESLAATTEESAALADALVEIGCYYWPGHGTSHRVWLQAVAARLRERTPRHGRRSRRRPPTFSLGQKRKSST
jgi:hypothetical protein